MGPGLFLLHEIFLGPVELSADDHGVPSGALDLDSETGQRAKANQQRLAGEENVLDRKLLYRLFLFLLIGHDYAHVCADSRPPSRKDVHPERKTRDTLNNEVLHTRLPKARERYRQKLYDDVGRTRWILQFANAV